MTLQLLYPASPFNRRDVDEEFAEEFRAVTAKGLYASLVDDEFPGPGLAAHPPMSPRGLVVYRGWMLGLEAYARMESLVEGAGANLLTPKTAYALTHHLPNWYPVCEDLTARTVMLAEDVDFGRILPELTPGWAGYFVKDWVKSLTTGQGSVAEDGAGVAEVVRALKHYRGAIEGGVCVRELTCFEPNTEARYFVVNGVAYGATHDVPAVVRDCARRVRGSAFFSVDAARTRQGKWQIVELGDGQVSDRKEWPLSRFVDLLSKLV